MTSVVSTGTLTTAVGSEQTVATLTTAGENYEFNFNIGSQDLGDVITFRAKKQIGAAVQTYLGGVYANKQTTPVVVTPPITCIAKVEFSIEQSSGSSFSIPWEVRAL